MSATPEQIIESALRQKAQEFGDLPEGHYYELSAAVTFKREGETWSFMTSGMTLRDIQFGAPPPRRKWWKFW